MGNGTVFRCEKCGYEDTVMNGIGFRFPDLYQGTVNAIKAGEYGREWEEFFKRTSGAAVNAGLELYVCPVCNNFETALNLSLYAPNSQRVSKRHNIPFAVGYPAADMEYVMPHELDKDYHLVKEFEHKCTECGGKMEVYSSGDRLKCPLCKDGLMEEADRIMWD